ncbi:MAG: phage major capsid protein, partial [Bacteroidales bacterium]|nr:phage major capsid protein [Bacteroidales bacterium]
MQTSDADKFDSAMEEYSRAIASEISEQFAADAELYKQTQDKAILERRGVRTLTNAEQKFYEKLIDVMKSGNPKQAFVEIIGTDDEDDIMPNTIIEDVFRQLTEEHPLLSRIQTQNVAYLTKWILNNHTAQTAAWGAITAEITQEITSSLKVVDIKQNKLSCFAILEKGMADLGPAFLDAYIRTVMYEAMALALETGIISGSGDGCPTGMDRDLTSTTVAKAQKSAVTVTDFTPASYGELLAGFAKDENGKQRAFASVALICNQEDYLKKIMPATTVLNSAGVYVNNLFPFPTEVIISNGIATGSAIIGLLDEYELFIGQAARNNVIEYSDEYRFLEDQRVFKVVQYADGRAYDNTSFQLLDISGLEPAYLNVKTVGSESEEQPEKA